MKKTPIFQRLAQLIQQNQNCVKANNTEWEQKSRAEAHQIAKDKLPSGSGIDCGTKLDFEVSTPDRLVLLCSFHHMNDNGVYDGWTEHKVIVTASLQFGFDVKITGDNRRDIKDYLAEVYTLALREEV